jgi:hypothetical protein
MLSRFSLAKRTRLHGTPTTAYNLIHVEGNDYQLKLTASMEHKEKGPRYVPQPLSSVLLLAKLGRFLLNLIQISHHFSIAIPNGVFGIVMEGAHKH